MNPIIILIIAVAVLTSAVILLSFYFLNRKLDLLLCKPAQEKPTGDTQQLMALKIQAYERIILYIERIELEGLVMRTFLPEMTVQQLQAALFRTIREEFEHNTTQQLYVSERAWECTKGARALVLALITQSCQELAPTDNGMQLAQTLFTSVQDKEAYVYEKFPLFIKQEMRQEVA
ncbi:MAG: hypothetical protein FWG84_02210 [Bacteroidales bacterium]|nr:hypothetical protein [Bacteroidales bacterium]